MLLAFVLGNYCDFFIMPKIAIVLAALCGITLPFFPDTPTFLVKQNKIDVSVAKRKQNAPK